MQHQVQSTDCTRGNANRLSKYLIAKEYAGNLNVKLRYLLNVNFIFLVGRIRVVFNTVLLDDLLQDMNISEFEIY